MTTRLMSVATLPESEDAALRDFEDVALPGLEDVAMPEPEVGTPPPESDLVTRSEPETSATALDFLFDQWMRFMTLPMAAMAAFDASPPGRALDRMTRVDELL